jgi:hypothetical protein
MQSNSHADLLITGERDALAALRDAINKALDTPNKAYAASAYTGDGEGYYAIVVNTELLLLNDKPVSEQMYWYNVKLPYLTLDAEYGKCPWDTFSKEISCAIDRARYDDED